MGLLMFFCFRFVLVLVLFLCSQRFIFFNLHHDINSVSLRWSSLSGLFVVHGGPLHCGLYRLLLLDWLFLGIFRFLRNRRFLRFCLLFLLSTVLFSWPLLLVFCFGRAALFLCRVVAFSLFDVIVVSSSSSLSGRM